MRVAEAVAAAVRVPFGGEGLWCLRVGGGFDAVVFAQADEPEADGEHAGVRGDGDGFDGVGELGAVAFGERGENVFG